MAFTPTLTITVEGQCTTLTITDTTGADVGVGTGWDGVSGLTSGGLTSAMVSITGPSGANVTASVLSDITGASPITGDFDFTGITGTWTDGLYSVRYSVATGATAIDTDYQYFLYCNAQNCVDALFAKLSTMVSTDYASQEARQRVLDNALTAEGLLMALKSSIASASTTALNSIVARINRICAFESCTSCG